MKNSNKFMTVALAIFAVACSKGLDATTATKILNEKYPTNEFNFEAKQIAFGTRGFMEISGDNAELSRAKMIGSSMGLWRANVDFIVVNRLPQQAKPISDGFSMPLYDWSFGKILSIRETEGGGCDAEVRHTWSYSPKSTLGEKLVEGSSSEHTSCFIKTDKGWTLKNSNK